MFSAQEFAAAHSGDGDKLFHEVAANIGESLLRWPKGRLNPTQAKRVRIRAFDSGLFTMDLPPEWK